MISREYFSSYRADATAWVKSMTTGRCVESSATSEATAGPLPGLRPYEAEDAAFFFGSDAQVGELVGRLRVSRILAVVGTSGSGKSSIVRAGLLPALHRG